MQHQNETCPSCGTEHPLTIIDHHELDRWGNRTRPVYDCPCGARLVRDDYSSPWEVMETPT